MNIENKIKTSIEQEKLENELSHKKYKLENLNRLIEEHKKETHPYKRYEFDSISYTLLLIDINNLLKENQELKSQLAGTTHCFDEEEHRKLKDEIKKLERIIKLCHLDAKETLATINYEQESQQKEFIKYLEDMLDDENDMFSVVRVKDVLQKYKEIIGADK